MKASKPIFARGKSPGHSEDSEASGPSRHRDEPHATKDGRHPAWGALKDITHVPPGLDLTEPAFPDWEKVWLEANAWWLDDPKLNPKR